MEFWKNNSCIPSWIEYSKSWWYGEKPRVLDLTPSKRNGNLPAGCTIWAGGIEHATLLKEFWYRYFSLSSKCKCFIPEHIIKQYIHTKLWEVWILINNRNEIVGTIVRKNVGSVSVLKTVFQQMYLVDYFCVHPAWRGRGIGRALLNHLHNQTKYPFAPHLILWEGLQVSVPPISIGAYWWREGKGVVPSSEEVKDKTLWRSIVEKKDIYSLENKGLETTVWKVKKGYVILWNTFHRTVPEGKEIYILLHGTNEEAIEEYIMQSPNSKVFLRPRGITESIVPGWQYDSNYQWVVYNLLYKGGLEFPCIGF